MFIKTPSVRSKESTSQESEDSNAYADADDWTAADLGALSSSIQQHTANLRDGGDEEEEEEEQQQQQQQQNGNNSNLDELPSRPVNRGGMRPPPRNFTSLGASGEAPHSMPTTTPTTGTEPRRDPRALFQQHAKKRKQRQQKKQEDEPKQPKPVKPALRVPRYSRKSFGGGGGGVAGDDASQGGQSRVSFAETVKTHSFTTNQQLRTGTRIRAIIALLCLVFAVVMAVLLGNGTIGLWLTDHFVGAPGSTAEKEEPNSNGLPGALGVTPAYNGTFEIPDLASKNILLSPSVENFADWRIPFPASNRSQLPLYWDVPRSGVSVLQRILSKCLDFVEASQAGAGHTETTLQVFESPQGARYLNVDTYTFEGLQRAKNLGVTESGIADVMYTPLVIQAAGMFSPSHPGRLFSIFREPIERAMSVYNFARTADPSVAEMSLVDFATNVLPNNEMVRTLSGRNANDDLSDDDLYLAMEILRRKCVIGLVDRMEDSMVRFHRYFGWYSLLVEGVAKCQTNQLAPNEQRPAAPAPGSEAYNVMMNQNRLDIRLFEYAQYLYDIQGGTTTESA